jgi:hypothetical protein
MVKWRDHREDKHPSLRWGAIGVALAAFGATALFAREKGLSPMAVPDALTREGRGERVGPIDASSLEAGYEIVDTNVGALVKVMLISVAIGAFSVALVFWMFARFNTHYQDTRIGMTRQQSAAIEPPLPHLQAAPYRDIDATIMEQKRRVETYGWNDPEHTSAHIPIARAMQQVVGKSLDADASSDASGAPATRAAMPELPAYSAARPQDKPGNSVQGEGRPGSIAPSYEPKATETKP